nr:MAG TPA: hypothetical protein [Caudoviricetes sp.]
MRKICKGRNIAGVMPSLILSLKIIKHLYDIEIRVATV